MLNTITSDNKIDDIINNVSEVTPININMVKEALQSINTCNVNNDDSDIMIFEGPIVELSENNGTDKILIRINKKTLKKFFQYYNKFQFIIFVLSL